MIGGGGGGRASHTRGRQLSRAPPLLLLPNRCHVANCGARAARGRHAFPVPSCEPPPTSLIEPRLPPPAPQALFIWRCSQVFTLDSPPCSVLPPLALYRRLRASHCCGVVPSPGDWLAPLPRAVHCVRPVCCVGRCFICLWHRSVSAFLRWLVSRWLFHRAVSRSIHRSVGRSFGLICRSCCIIIIGRSRR